MSQVLPHGAAGAPLALHSRNLNVVERGFISGMVSKINFKPYSFKCSPGDRDFGQRPWCCISHLGKTCEAHSVGFLHEHCSFLVVPDTLQARRCSEDNSCYADAIRSDPIDEM